MATLTNTKIKDTYKSLLKVSDNGNLEASLQEITDGEGNASGVQLNTGGDLTASGTVAFGSLRDSGENITITKFVDEADGIGSNDNDTSIPTSAAVKNYVDTNVTAQDLDFAGDSGTGAVDLDSQTFTISGTANEIETSASGQTITIGLPSTITANVNGNVTGNLTGTVLTAAQTNITSVGTLSSLAVSGNLTVDTNTLFVNASANRVGINTNSPSQRLHILEDTATAAYARVSNSVGVFEAGIDASGNGEIGTTTSDALILNTQGTERMRILASGEIGINTATPSRRFTVNSEGIQIGSLFESTSAISTQINIKNANSTNGGFIKTTGDNIILTANNTGAEHLVVADGGNVGIGESDPSGYWSQAHNLVLSDSNTGITIKSATNGNGRLIFTDTKSATAGLSDGGMIHYDHNSDSMQLHANGSERMRIDSTGKVGIGTSSPESVLHVVANTTNNQFILERIGTSTGKFKILTVNDALTIRNEALATDNFLITSTGVVDIKSSGTAAEPSLRLGGDGDTGWYRPTSNTIAFTTAGAERMRIDSSGNVLIGKTATGASGTKGIEADPNGFLGIVNDFADGVGSSVFINRNSGTGVFLRLRKSNIDVGSISTDGTSTSYNTSSDYRLKENVVEMTGALDRVDALKPSRFNFIADPETTVDGFIAHEVQAIVPEAVTGEKDAVDEEGNPVYQGIDQSKIVPLLVGAIQELKAEIESLKSQLNA